MRFYIHKIWNDRKWLSAACGGLAIGLLGVSTAALAQTNPRPSIFDEPLYNNNPRPVAPSPGTSTVPTTPEPTPITVISPTNGTATITMVNATGANISYQVIGDTQYRTLAGETEVALRDLSIPTTLTFRREDNGLLQVTVEPDATGTLTLTLDETEDFSIDRTTLVIDEEGSVFLN